MRRSPPCDQQRREGRLTELQSAKGVASLLIGSGQSQGRRLCARSWLTLDPRLLFSFTRPCSAEQTAELNACVAHRHGSAIPNPQAFPATPPPTPPTPFIISVRQMRARLAAA